MPDSLLFLPYPFNVNTRWAAGNEGGNKLFPFTMFPEGHQRLEWKVWDSHRLRTVLLSFFLWSWDTSFSASRNFSIRNYPNAGQDGSEKMPPEPVSSVNLAEWQRYQVEYAETVETEKADEQAGF